MKRLTILIIALLTGLNLFAYKLPADSAAHQSPSLTTNIDTLKRMLQVTTNDTLKSALYTQLAAQYLNYEHLDNKTKRNFQAQALYYSYEALHLYSGMNDTVGLRTSFNSLAKVYRSQHKYPQAKWFILQSNSLSRAIKDVPNIMSSLLVLANIKMEIKDYRLAMRDLDEALKLSKTNHYATDESKIEEGYVLLYTHLKNYTKADIAAKRRDFINDSLLKGEQSLIAKTQDSLQVKKKVFTIKRKPLKTSSSKKIASL
jgi:tetratricopeptide (TPR) repeat protein